MQLTALLSGVCDACGSPTQSTPARPSTSLRALVVGTATRAHGTDGCLPPKPIVPAINGTVEEFLEQRCAAEPCPAHQRYDECLRDDAFAAYAGNANAMDRMWCRLQADLAKNPEHPEALVWRGGLKLYTSGFAYRSGDFELGGRLQAEGFSEIDRAVVLAPQNIGVRIQRLTVLVASLPYYQDEQRLALIDKAQSDLDARLAVLDEIEPSAHGRGELWALRIQLQHYRVEESGEAERKTAEAELASLLTALMAELPDTSFAHAASCWLEGKNTAQISCFGCHNNEGSRQ